MGKYYGQLSLEERCKVAELQQAGHSLRQIAAALDRSPSSVCRELKRNRGAQVGYKPVHAQEQGAVVALDAAADAAESGAAATAAMKPRLGRASYLGDRAIGIQDGGATAVAIWMRALSQCFRD